MSKPSDFYLSTVQCKLNIYLLLIKTADVELMKSSDDNILQKRNYSIEKMNYGTFPNFLEMSKRSESRNNYLFCTDL